VIIVDSSILIYAYTDSFPQHVAARTWLNHQLNGPARLGLPWVSLLAFLRVTTNRRLFERAAPMAEAWQQVTEWLECDPVWIPEPGNRHADILGTLLLSASVDGNLVPAAHIAALAIEQGLTLCSSDRDFARFPGLRWENPLAA
jgi:hypothetical protein